MERELVELFGKAKKAADASLNDDSSSSGPEVSRCVDSLKQLRKFEVTSEILVSTQVGKKLRPLAKHPKEKIQAAASDLLETWKKIVIDETMRKKNGGIDSNSSVTAEVSKSATVKVEKLKKASMVKVSTSETVKVEKMDQDKTVKVAKTFKEEIQTSSVKKPSQAPTGPPKLKTLVKCNDALRDKIRELLAEAFSKVASEADEDIRDEVEACDPIRVAVSVESEMFEKLGRSNGAQKLKYRSIMFNIKDPKNPDLRRKVLLGQVQPPRLVTMPPEEMASEQRKRENNQIKEKALFDCERSGKAEATTDQFKCGRCGQRKCTYYQMQTRSADEPMTTYVTCVNCNNHWKFC
ncbi:transcription elongation factor S-II [Salix suchowensis]|nr:transcription elongation factor S-II [Salix suchowensis]